MKGKMFMLALLVSVSLAGQGFASGHGGCSTCGPAEASCAEATCCEPSHKRCDLFAGLKGLFACKKCSDSSCEPACEPACEPVCDPEPACEPACAPEPDCNSCSRKGLLDGLFSCKKGHGHGSCCETACEPACDPEPACEPACAPEPDCNSCGSKGLLNGLFSCKKGHGHGHGSCCEPACEPACEPVCESEPCCKKRGLGLGLLDLLDDLFACKKKSHGSCCETAHDIGCGTGGCGGCGGGAVAAPANAPAAAPVEKAAPLPIAPAPKADPSAALMGNHRIYQANVIRH